MLPYIILIATVCVLSLVCFNRFTKNYPPRVLKIIFLSASFLFLFIFSSLRVNIGFDYLQYSQGFFKMGIDGFSTVAYKDWEWGFNILTKIIVFFTRDIHVYMAVVSLICLAGPFYVIYRYSKKVWLSVVLYINLYFFYCTMNFLRQSIAISIALFAYSFLIDRKFWRFVLIILIAAVFHSTVLMMIPAYIMANFKPSLRIPLLYAYLILWVFISSNSTLDILTEYIHGEYRNSVFLTKGLDIIHTVIPTLIVGAGMCLMLKFIKPKNIADSDKSFVILTNLMYFSYFWIIVMLRHAIFERFSYYTYILVVLYVPEIIAFVDRKYRVYVNKEFNVISKSREISDVDQQAFVEYYRQNRKRLLLMITVTVIIITLSYNIFGLIAYERGAHGIYPYKSWYI